MLPTPRLAADVWTKLPASSPPLATRKLRLSTTSSSVGAAGSLEGPTPYPTKPYSREIVLDFAVWRAGDVGGREFRSIVWRQRLVSLSVSLGHRHEKSVTHQLATAAQLR
ncbi:unnamed protein product [Linum tenue]|uniref:Uncharacterized protein n=1 Tax=Linum tenue TaxID=586396 RepID=A0AAV0H733_9ROSI|nr:unnamed protein product [Linum tenue]CAI0381093.1 unnamed protein product [Linum tenue]